MNEPLFRKPSRKYSFEFFAEIDEPQVTEIVCFMEEDVGPKINIIIIIILDVWQLSMKWFILIHKDSPF